MDWIEPNKQLPPQGKKVLCLHNSGDLSVRIRFKEQWLPTPFLDSSLADCLAPELWANIEMPGNLTGLFRVIHKGKTMDMDEYEKVNPSGFDKMHKYLVAAVGKPFMNIEEYGESN